MKKIVYYTLMMFIVVIMLPVIIVKGCGVHNSSGGGISKIDYGGEKSNVKIKVYFHTLNKVEEIPLEEYLKGVVAAEMPAEFDIEALKAQAVAARTYAYDKMQNAVTSLGTLHDDADVCTDFTHCQAWTSKEDAMEKWGVLSGQRYWTKIETAVQETANIIIVYNNQVIDHAVFHSNSGGKTENSEDVWENVIPYLKSVPSFGEDGANEYKDTIVIKNSEFYAKLKKEYPTLKLDEKDVLKDIKMVSFSEGDRVKTLKVGNVTLKGTDLRRILSLKSTNFTIEKEGTDSIKITTIGYGHGVGMSQRGANYLAKNGGSFEEILKYYYQGVELREIQD